MKRKSFIKNVGVAAAAYPLLSALHACNLDTGKRNRVMVLIQLIGGNDGLNTLIPMNEYEKLAKARPNLYIPESKVISIKGKSDVALHPSVAGIKDLMENNLAAFVQGVGYEGQNYSHFRSADIYLTGAKSTEVLYTGWLARYLECRFKNYPQGFPSQTFPDPPAIKVGDNGTFLFEGSAMDMSIVINPATGFDAPVVEESVDNNWSLAAKEVKSIRDILLQTSKYSGSIQAGLSAEFEHSKLYPKQGDNPLADQLKIVAKLINSGLQTSIYHVDLKGFDTHSEQVDSSNSTKGQHANLLAQLSQAITCFWDDMNKIGRENDVTGMAFSEFGRRIISNSAYGTDHGSSQPVLFFGNNLAANVIGNNPVIPDNPNSSDNLAMQVDFRAVYSSVLKNLMGVNQTDLSKILPGNHAEVKLFKAQDIT